MDKINLQEKFALFDDLWSPKIIGEANGQFIKIAKTNGEMVWHKHDDEDEIFIVIKGKFILEMRDKTVELNAGEIFVMPQGVEHCPRATEETQVLLIEPKKTAHTGNSQTAMTVAIENQNWI